MIRPYLTISDPQSKSSVRMGQVQVRRSRSSTIRWFQAVVAHPAFDIFFAAIVGLNTIFMGVDAELQLADQLDQGESVALTVTRRVFTVAFTAT